MEDKPELAAIAGKLYKDVKERIVRTVYSQW